MPQGQCFLWKPEVLWLHVVSDTLIALAYYSIPIALFFIAGRRRVPGLRRLMLMFGAFILASGATHAIAVWNIWHAAYGVEGMVKAATAILSVITAVVTIQKTPAALRLTPPGEMDQINHALVQEIAARTEAEEQLRRLMESQRLASEAKIGAYFEAAPQAILIVAPDDTIALVNRSAEQMFGYTRAELVGRHLAILIPPAKRDIHAVHRFEFFHEPRIRPMGKHAQLTAVRKDGTEFPVEIGLSYAKTEDGVLAMALVNDITERKRSEHELAMKTMALRASEAQLRSFLEAAAQAILAVSQDGRIMLVNRCTEEMFGYRREELLGQELELLLPARYQHAHVRHRAGFFSEPRRRPMGPGSELWGRRKDGSEFPVEVGLSFVDGGGGVLALGLISDITERKRSADELAAAVDDLRRSNAELEQFAYVASHDLQEPLRMITSYLNLLERRCRGKLDADGEEFLRYAVNGAERMKGLIRDFLQVSRISRQALKLEPSPADAMVENALGNLAAAIDEHNATIVVEPLPVVPADPVLLTQVFQNLVGNAIKFHATQAPEIHISARQQDGLCVFAVRDNGIGIAPQHAERIFRIFERLHEVSEYPGSGIGLAVSRKIVERHGGTIWFESEPGAGSTFYFAIPSKMEKPRENAAVS